MTHNDQRPIDPKRWRERAGLAGRITAQAAEAEPEAERTFPPENGASKENGAPKPAVTLSTVVEHRGRQITVTATDMTVDQFCDLLERRGYAPPQEPQQWQTLPDGTPICPKHHAPMRLREKQGDRWWSHNVGTKDAPLYCRGYHGKDSPGYEH
jgi:hypothetical protein